jgi:predicted ATP-binding protein involved in virulence
MILKSLRLKNFRRFDQLEVSFHHQLTVIVACNGQGKTSILDAVTIALGTFVGAFDLGKIKHMENNCARFARLADSPYNEQNYPVRIEASFGEPEMNICRELTGPKSKTTVKDAAQLTAYGKSLQLMVRGPERAPLPVVAYYGVGRLWKSPKKNVMRKNLLSASRTLGYEDCLLPASNFTLVQEWMAQTTYQKLQQLEMPEALRGADKEIPIKIIQNAVNLALKDEGWSSFHYSLSYGELSMQHPETGTLPVSLLSDGVRAMVSLVADLAFRCVYLNGFIGQAGDPIKESKGIVLIDEVDIHLHPAWQQRVIHSLLELFPKIQFIVTSHSPQLLTTVKPESIRSLTFDNGHAAVKEDFQFSEGAEAQLLLEEILGVNARPPKLSVVQTLNNYLALVSQDRWDSEEAMKLREILDNWSKGNEVALTKADMDIRMRQFRRTKSST